MRKVAIEPTLSHVREALQQQGYQVVPLQPGHRIQADAYVVSGMSNNLLGIQDTDGNQAPVINAAGLTTDQVVEEVRRRLPETGPTPERPAGSGPGYPPQ